MNKEEFLELQREFAQDVYNFEFFLKRELYADFSYNNVFFDELMTNRKLDLENKMLFDAIKMHNESNLDVSKFIDKTRQDYANECDVSFRKHANVKALLEKNKELKEEDLKAFEEYFHEFVLENNPIVRLNQNKETQSVYEMLTRLYRENNIENFKALYNTNSEVFLIDKEVDPSRYVEFSRVYYNTRKKFNSVINQAPTRYPFNKEATLKDANSIEKERKLLKEKEKSLLEANESLHKDFYKVFGKDILIG
ncbi:MAG: hypothetical protein IJU60_05320 [Acholeplasmatales bacterium]|nr:hypothetical protein [Acholeplasmatales bacterium]